MLVLVSVCDRGMHAHGVEIESGGAGDEYMLIFDATLLRNVLCDAPTCRRSKAWTLRLNDSITHLKASFRRVGFLRLARRVCACLSSSLATCLACAALENGVPRRIR
jgi:hypothetical protein